MSVALILEMGASVLMLLRNKRCSNNEDDYTPLGDSDFFLKAPMDRNTMDTERILDQLIMAIDLEIPDNGEPKPRQGSFDATYHDDEQRCRSVMNYYYKFVTVVPKKVHKKFYKKIGTLFSSILQFIYRNGLVLRQYIQSSQQARPFSKDMTDEERDAIIQRREYPNHRISIFTNIGYFESSRDEGLIKKITDSLFQKQSLVNRDAYKVL